MYRLYYSPGACSLAVHIVLEEIGEPYEAQIVSATGAHEGMKTASAEWREINPKGRVPALLGVPGGIGGQPNLLTEAPAILFYLARSHPAAGLLPADAAGEARCLEWTNWLSGTVHGQSFGQIWRPQRFLADEKDFPALKAKGEENLREQFAYIESVLADGRDWAVPGRYSIVDPFLFVFYSWGLRLGMDMAGQYPAWTALAKKIHARPAVRRTLDGEGIRLPL